MEDLGSCNTQVLISIIKLITAISFELTRQAETRTPPVSLGQTGLTGRDDRSDRSNRFQPSWGPPHLNYSLSSPHYLPHPPHAQLKLRLSPSHFSPQTLGPKSIHPPLIQGPRELQLGGESSSPRAPSLVGLDSSSWCKDPKVNDIGVGIDLLF